MKFLIDRFLIRLGEFDTKTSKDEPHLDFWIDKSEKHEEHNENLRINDIAIVHLLRNVEFNGETFYPATTFFLFHEHVIVMVFRFRTHSANLFTDNRNTIKSALCGH